MAGPEPLELNLLGAEPSERQPAAAKQPNLPYSTEPTALCSGEVYPPMGDVFPLLLLKSELDSESGLQDADS